MPRPWIELKEARGRIVKRMNIAYDEEYVAVEVEFEDGHSMNVDIIPAVQIRPQFQHVGTGDTRMIRSYKSRISVAGGLKIQSTAQNQPLETGKGSGHPKDRVHDVNFRLGKRVSRH